MKYYLDASALVKRFKPEPGYKTIRQILYGAAQGLHEAHSLDWARAEFGVALSRAGVPQAVTLQNLRVLRRVVVFQPIQPAILDAALNLIFQLKLHAADAAHLAACKRLECEAFATDDEHLTRDAVHQHLERQAIQLVNLQQLP